MSFKTKVLFDKMAIVELIAGYNAVMDNGDIHGWANCFAPEGVFDGMIGGFAVPASWNGARRVVAKVEFHS